MNTDRADFVRGEVLGNVDGEWRTAMEIRGALRLTVPKVSGVLNSLRYRGVVESRLHRRECPTCGHGDLRIQWRKVSPDRPG